MRSRCAAALTGKAAAPPRREEAVVGFRAAAYAHVRLLACVDARSTLDALSAVLLKEPRRARFASETTDRNPYDAKRASAVSPPPGLRLPGRTTFVEAPFWALGGRENDSSLDDDVFVIRLDATGGLMWARSFNGAGALRAWDLAVDAAGNISIVGSFEGDATIAGESHSVFNAGYSDGYVVKLAPDGSTHWVRVYGQWWNDALFGVDVDGDGHAYVAGSFDDAVVLDATTVPAEGYVDAFVVNLGP